MSQSTELTFKGLAIQNAIDNELEEPEFKVGISKGSAAYSEIVKDIVRAELESANATIPSNFDEHNFIQDMYALFSKALLTHPVENSLYDSGYRIVHESQIKGKQYEIPLLGLTDSESSTLYVSYDPIKDRYFANAKHHVLKQKFNEEEMKDVPVSFHQFARVLDY